MRRLSEGMIVLEVVQLSMDADSVSQDSENFEMFELGCCKMET